MISFKEVTFTYPGSARPALHSVNLEISPRDFVLVMGPSGSGKSTLLRCLNGLVPHFSGGTLHGAIQVAGYDPVLASPQVMSRQVGFVFQDPETQFVVDRVEDEVAFALENLALAPDEIGARLDSTLEMVGLSALRQRPLDSLSGGERQRVALAAVLALTPRVLVLDEPTSQLDPAAAEAVLQTLVRINQDMDITILLAEHRLERVLPYINRVIYMPGEDGKIQVGEPHQVLARVDFVSPVIRVGKFLNWQPLPMTVAEAKSFADQTHIPPLGGCADLQNSEAEREIALRVENLHVLYGSEPALSGIDLTVGCGEILVLLGSNGAGKTTLLRSLVGLIKPDAGKIELFGKSIAGKDAADLSRQIGYLPQDPNSLLFADQVIDELLFTLRNQELPGLGRKKASLKDWEVSAVERSMKLLSQMGLADLAAAYPRDLSVGQRQRVALAAMMIAEPRLLLLDEPTRGLDLAAKLELAEILEGWRDAGKAIVLVTHDVELAARLADRVVLLESGQVIADGPPREVLLSFPKFTPQMLQLFPQSGCLTPEEVLLQLIPD